MRLLLLLWPAFALIHAIVNFSDSALYDYLDIYRYEAPLPKCDFGCHIYISITGDPTEWAYVFDYIFIHDNVKDVHIASYHELASRVDNNRKKIPLIINGPANISVINDAGPGDPGYPSVLYVVANSAVNSNSYEVYDVSDNVGWVYEPESPIITFISPIPYKLQIGPINGKISVILAGFDNAAEENKDNCGTAYETEEFGAVFAIQPNTPLVTLFGDFIGKKPSDYFVKFRPSYEFTKLRNMSEGGFISSPGWNGCMNPNSGGFQSFRTKEYLPTDAYLLTMDEEIEAHIDVLSHFDRSHELRIDDDEQQYYYSVKGTTDIDILIGPEPFHLNISYEDMIGDQGFMLQYSYVATPKASTTLSAKTDSPSTTQATWTSSDNYCKCGFADGWFDNWSPNEIWLDLIVILDTSAAMGDSLEEAKSALTSFISLMSTDTSAVFYSRIGVIAASDTIEARFPRTYSVHLSLQIVYNLNMSSSDKLSAVKQHEIDQIDLGAAFDAALKMFTDGKQSSSYRSNARQIVYFLTNSAPYGTDTINGTAAFKEGGGIIIVNDFVLEGQVAEPALKMLASENFYFTDLSENYLNNLGVLCEANCYCKESKHPFNDDGSSPRTQANHVGIRILFVSCGCFHPVNNGIPQSAARETCQNERAALVSIHDQHKEFFVSSVVSVFGPKKKYWLGLQNDGAAWNWEDNSTDSFTDWDTNQPNTKDGQFQCAYATQTTGLNVRWTAANCAMGGVMYVCESAPCSRGHNDC